MEVKLFPRDEEVPEYWVPIPATSTDWSLDKAELINVKRRGFALSPDFSSTIHSATGRTLESAVPDLGTIEDVPNSQRAMEGYIAISRVASAEGLIIAQPFAPALFRQGPAPYPTLLLQVLIGEVSQLELEEKLDEIEKATPETLLKNMSFKCGVRAKDLAVSKFINQEKTLKLTFNVSLRIL